MTGPPACARSSRSTRPRSARRSAAPGSTRTRPRPTPWPTCSTCPAAWRTRTRSPASTTAAARPSSSGDPTTDKTEALLRAYGRFVESLGGRYVTACDVGTYVQDMDVVARESRFVTGRSPSEGGAGDSSVLTAWGVFQGMRACAERQWGTASLAGRRVGIAGRRQGRPAPGRPPGRRRRRGRGHRRLRGRGRRGRRQAPAGPHGRRRRRPGPRSASTSTRRARSAARCPTPSSTCSPPRSSAAPPTTSSPTPGWRRSWPTAACSTRRTTWSTPAV